MSRQASRVKVTRGDGEIVYQQANGRSRRSVPTSIQRDVFARDGKCCRYCGFKHSKIGRFVIDHVVPVVRGGKDELGNLVVACRLCNQAKGQKLWVPLSLLVARGLAEPIPLWRVRQEQSMSDTKGQHRGRSGVRGYVTPGDRARTELARRQGHL